MGILGILNSWLKKELPRLKVLDPIPRESAKSSVTAVDLFGKR